VPWIGIGPTKRLGGLSIKTDVAHDFAAEVSNRSEDAAVDDLALELRKPDLHLI
jgi:hypothetical protein